MAAMSENIDQRRILQLAGIIPEDNDSTVIDANEPIYRRREVLLNLREDISRLLARYDLKDIVSMLVDFSAQLSDGETYIKELVDIENKISEERKKQIELEETKKNSFII